MFVLEEIVVPNLEIIFCGTAARKASVKARSYYAHRQNKFWEILAETKLTPSKLKSEEFKILINYGIGLTDLIKYHSGMDHEIPLRRLRKESQLRLHTLIEKHQPRFLAFTSLRAGREFFGTRRLPGAQSEMIGNTKIWILPSTSGAARRHWHPEIWHEFTAIVKGKQ